MKFKSNKQRKAVMARMKKAKSYTYNSFIKDQFKKAEKGHDPVYKMKIKVYGTGGDSNMMVVDKKGYEKIKKIMVKQE